MDLRRPSRRLGRPPPAFGRSPAELDTSCVRRLVPPRNFRVATNRHARVAAGANDSSRNVEHRGWKQELGASGTSVRAGYRSRLGEHEAVTIDGGFEWYGSLDPGTLSRFPTEVLETERIGPWTDPQLLLMEIQGRRVLVANVRMMLPSVVIQLVAHSTNDRSQTIRPASRSTRTSPPLDVDRRARPRRRDSPRRRLQYSSAYAVSRTSSRLPERCVAPVGIGLGRHGSRILSPRPHRSDLDFQGNSAGFRPGRPSRGLGPSSRHRGPERRSGSVTKREAVFTRHASRKLPHRNRHRRSRGQDDSPRPFGVNTSERNPAADSHDEPSVRRRFVSSSNNARTCFWSI